MATPTSAVKVNPLTGALIDPIAATFASANGFLTGGTSDAKESVVCATTTNGTLATAYENGDTVDGITLATGNRILLKNQSAQAQNGIYTVNASGAPTRATDFDAWTEIVGAFVTVEAGTVNAGTQWLCNVVSGGTLGTTAITFVVPKNFVDLTTTQTIAGQKAFTDANSSYGGIKMQNGFGAVAVDGTLFFAQDQTQLGIVAGGVNEDLYLRYSGNTDVTLPASGTLATTTGNVATATALATARNIFNISFNGTANVAGDATNTGHFASIPGTGAAGHFVTENGTAPTLISGRSAWYSDGSGIPSFKNGTGTAVTLVRSSDLGTNVATFLATPSGANLASALTTALPETKGGTNQTTYTTGDLLYASAANTLSKLADVATGNALISGGVTTAPSWGKIALTTHVSGTLPIANGGTGADSLQSQTFALLCEEFASGGNSDQQIGNLGWRNGSVGGTGGSGGFTNSTASHPGQYTLTTASAYAASVSDCYGIWLGAGGASPFNLLDAQEIRFTFSMASIANVKVKIGMTNDQTVYASNRGEYIGFDTSLSETNFMGVTKDGGAETRTSTGVAAGTGWFTVKIRYISSTSIGFSVSSAGGAFSSETVIAQTTGGGGRYPLVFIGNNAAAAKSITVDFFSYYLPNITR